ncbi:MAG: excinuclease ABC subunit UvrA [Patescibacteria group bacterium]
MDAIIVKGARVHNLKNMDVEIPRNKFVVLTGISGSGKSSLAFDTIYAEGQRRYVESLSAYARQFLGLMDKPDVDDIRGLSPAISIDQKSVSHNPRSTVGTVTEIYDYLRLLWARIGHPHCPQCGREVMRQTVDQIISRLLQFPDGAVCVIYGSVIRDKKGEHKSLLLEIARAGFARVRVDGVLMSIDEARDAAIDKQRKHSIAVVVDEVAVTRTLRDEQERGAQAQRSHARIITSSFTAKLNLYQKQKGAGAVGQAAGERSRLAQSLETALDLGDGFCSVEVYKGDTNETLVFSEHFACPVCDVSLPDLEPRLFSFNSPHGACSGCTGLGTKLEVDPDLVIPNKGLTIAQGAIRPWARTGTTAPWYMRIVEGVAEAHGFSLHTPIKNLTKKQYDLLLYGTGDRTYKIDYESDSFTGDYQTHFEGVIPNLERRYRETESDYIRTEIERYMRVLPCPVCGGKRLKIEALAVTVREKSLYDVTSLTIGQARDFFATLSDERQQVKQAARRAAPLRPADSALTERERTISRQILKEIMERLQFLLNVGLNYLTLDRSASTLSGGESQRIRLATQIGSQLSGVIYILDEPSIGLHQRDNAKLIATLKNLRDLGNTVLVVEHDEETIRSADHVIDIGPGAGAHGGCLVVQGTPAQVARHPTSLTGAYLSGKREIASPSHYRRGNGKYVVVKGARAFNLKNIDVTIPLGKLVCITGVSGSGKSTLMTEILAKALLQKFWNAREQPAEHDAIEGTEFLDKVIVIDQSPIGRTPRSNPATYTGVFTPIRELFTEVPEARMRGYRPGRFSFNVRGGRCEACQGDGLVRIEMHFLPDVYVECEECGGKRYNREALEIHYRGKTIADVLAMTVEEAENFFHDIPSIREKFATLSSVGLGYITLGQSATTLSGGEAQRVKLSSELSRRSTGRTLYILDEPTTGLHFEDVKRLLGVLLKLVDRGNTVLVIEHNLDVIKSADWIIDLGPEGGDEGGRIVAEGTPRDVVQVKASYTGQHLKKILMKDK